MQVNDRSQKISKLSPHTESYCTMSRESWAGCWMMP